MSRREDPANSWWRQSKIKVIEIVAEVRMSLHNNVRRQIREPQAHWVIDNLTREIRNEIRGKSQRISKRTKHQKVQEPDRVLSLLMISVGHPIVITAQVAKINVYLIRSSPNWPIHSLPQVIRVKLEFPRVPMNIWDNSNFLTINWTNCLTLMNQLKILMHQSRSPDQERQLESDRHNLVCRSTIRHYVKTIW